MHCNHSKCVFENHFQKNMHALRDRLTKLHEFIVGIALPINHIEEGGEGRANKHIKPTFDLM